MYICRCKKQKTYIKTTYYIHILFISNNIEYYLYIVYILNVILHDISFFTIYSVIIYICV